jgi:hypothetical protein
MELHLNELSATPTENKHAANNLMVSLSQVVAEARRKGFKNIRSCVGVHEVQLSDNYTLHNWLFDKEFSETHRSLLYGMIIQPFINEDDTDIENKYLEATYTFEEPEDGFPRKECFGLAAAHLYESPALSLKSHLIWQKIKLTITVQPINAEAYPSTVFNISSSTSYNDPELSEFIENLGEINLIKTEIAPDTKPNHISDHHGVKELRAYWKKLKSCPYVVEMKSTDWGGRRFIRNIYKTGAIELVLLDTEKRYAMWVKTTGRNYRETKKISQIIEEEYPQ